MDTGVEFPIMTKAVSVDGKTVRGIAFDISELQRVENALELKNQQLELALLQAQDASVSKSLFFASISHEIRTPLVCFIWIYDDMKWVARNNWKSGTFGLDRIDARIGRFNDYYHGML